MKVWVFDPTSGEGIPGFEVDFSEITSTGSQIQSAAVNTDNDGYASTVVRASASANQPVQIQALLRGTNVSQIFNLMITDLSSSLSYALSTLPSTVTAGSSFQWMVKIVDRNNNLDSSISGTRSLLWQMTTANSWAGMVPTVPSGNVDCTFVQGVCSGPTSVLMDSRSATSAWVSDSSSEIRPGFKSIVVNRGSAARLVIADHAGGPAGVDGLTGTSDDATALTSTRVISTDSAAVSYFAAIADVAGNYLSDASSAVWSGSITAISSNLSPLSGSQTTLSPNQTGSGSLGASFGSLTSATMPLMINPGAPSALTITTQNEFSGGESAGAPFKVTITAVDAKGNALRSHFDTNTGGFTGIFNMIVGFNNHFNLPYPSMGCSRIYLPSQGNSLWNYTAINCGGSNWPVAFIDGVSVTEIDSVLTNVLDTSVEFSFNMVSAQNGFPILAGVLTVPIPLGPKARIMVNKLPGSVTSWECQANAANSSSINCMTLSRAVYGSSGSSPGLVLYAVEEDQAGNFISTAAATWNAQGAWTGQLVVDSSNVFATLTPTTDGFGSISLTYDGITTTYYGLTVP